MKRSLWAVPAIMVVFLGWQIMSSRSQDNNAANGDDPVEVVPASGSVTNQPAAQVKPAEAVKPVEEVKPVEAAPASAPAATETPAALPAVEAPKPAETAKPAEEFKPVEAAPASAPAATDTPAVMPAAEAAKPAEEVNPSTTPVPAEAKPSATKTEKYELDRQPPSAAATSEEKDSKQSLETGKPAAAADAGKPVAAETAGASSDQDKKQAEQNTSFWGRLFGKGKGQSVSNDVAGASVETGPVQPGTAPAASPAEKKPPTQEEMLAAQEEVRRQAKEIEGLKNLDLGYQAMSRNEFEEALKFFNLAMSVMPMRPYTVDTRNKARLAQAQCEYRLALKYYQQGNIEEAKKASNLALSFWPTHKDSLRLNERIARDESRKLTAKPPPIRFSQEHLDKEQRIKGAISRGRQYMAVHEYEKAAYEFKSVVIEDKGNEEANANLKKIAEKGYKLETAQLDRMQAEMMTQVRDTWTPQLKQEIGSQPIKPPGETELVQPEKQRLLKKLNTIIIPQLDFRQANIIDVIKYLDQQSIISDKESAAGEKGVNIILNMKSPGATAAAAAPKAGAAAGGEEDLFSAEGGAAGVPSNIPTVTLTLRNIVLLDAIRFITEVTGLKYRIESNVVVITPADVVVGEVMTRTYRVQPNMGDIIGGAVAASAPGGTAGGGIGVELQAGGGAGATAERGGDVKKFFTEAGVPFPEGTSIKYQPSLNLIIVANTAENLEKFEQILLKLNDIPKQVEIEARFVEIGQTDLEELGIEWLLTDNWEIAQNAGAGAAVPLSARERIQMNKNSLTKGLRNYDNSSGTLGTMPGGTMAGILSISSILTNPELSVILHALEQRSGANLLSAPKITTKSGANAEIKVVKELIYPTEFEQQAQSVGTPSAGQQVNQLTQIIVTPTGFQTRDTGVILNVTPTVGPDGYTIDLTMMPQVVELAEWMDYGSTVLDPGGMQRKVPMPQPIFHSRSIATSISIWDGQTVVMGGLITEQQSTTVDKIPFLGDIPLIGYLFQSKTSQSVKRNLLIFVTANLVDPAGNKINKAPVDLAGAASSSKAAP